MMMVLEAYFRLGELPPVESARFLRDGGQNKTAIGIPIAVDIAGSSPAAILWLSGIDPQATIWLCAKTARFETIMFDEFML